MDGFILSDKDGQPAKVLAFPLLDNGVIDFPRLKIQERSNFHPAFALIAFLQAGPSVVHHQMPFTFHQRKFNRLCYASRDAFGSNGNYRCNCELVEILFRLEKTFGCAILGPNQAHSQPLN